MSNPFVPRDRSFIYGGETIRLYSIGWLSHLCNRHQQTIRRWQRLNVLPSPIFDLNDGTRWYSAAELIGYGKIVRQAKIRPGQNTVLAMRQLMALFKMRLMKIFEQEPQRIMKELPTEFSFKDLMRRHREDYWKQEAHKLLNEIIK